MKEWLAELQRDVVEYCKTTLWIWWQIRVLGRDSLMLLENQLQDAAELFDKLEKSGEDFAFMPTMKRALDSAPLPVKVPSCQKN